MFRVSFKDGCTLKFDLQNPVELEEWHDRRQSRDFQAAITAIVIVTAGEVFSLSRPCRFGHVVWDIDEVSHRGKVTRRRAHVYAGDIRVTATVYVESRPPQSKVQVSKVGRLRHPVFA